MMENEIHKEYFYRYLVKKPAESKPLIACLASQILKDHHPGLLQRTVSVLLYGNGVNKQVAIYIGRYSTV